MQVAGTIRSSAISSKKWLKIQMLQVPEKSALPDASCFVILAQAGLPKLDRWKAEPLHDASVVAHGPEAPPKHIEKENSFAEYESPLLCFRSYR